MVSTRARITSANDRGLNDMNILIIFSDQQHKYALGKRNPLYRTPNLDALADDGVMFTNAYSNNPVCGPFRGCLMTGLYTNHNGVINNNNPLLHNIPTMAGLLGESDWQTGFVGKWHLGGKGAGPIPSELRGGFNRFIGYQCYNGYDPTPPYRNRVAFFDENDEEHIYDAHRTDVTTSLAISMLEEMAVRPSPFCLLVGYQAPHYPEQPSEAFESLYSDTVFIVDKQSMSVEPYTPTFNPRSPEDISLCPDYRRYGGNMAEYKRLYAAMVTQVDHGVGNLIDSLKRLGVYDDTMIVFTSDHGDMQGSHGMKNKCLPYEQSAGIPMIVRMPNGRRAESSDLLVSGIDIFATVMEIAGIECNCDGHSFLKYVRGQSDQPFNDYVISQSYIGENKWQMIRTTTHKLVLRYPDNMPIMLFDMLKDNDERENLIGEDIASHYELCELLRERLLSAIE